MDILRSSLWRQQQPVHRGRQRRAAAWTPWTRKWWVLHILLVMSNFPSHQHRLPARLCACINLMVPLPCTLTQAEFVRLDLQLKALESLAAGSSYANVLPGADADLRARVHDSAYQEKLQVQVGLFGLMHLMQGAPAGAACMPGCA